MHVKELLSLKGKVVLVTGGAGLYGQCIFEALAEADGTVITASRSLENGENVAAALRAKGLDAYAMQVDQGDHTSILGLKNAIQKKFGRLDVFVNNSVARFMKRYDDPLDRWADDMRINATGMFDIVREMADLLAGSGGGSIVNIGSMFGVYGPDFSNYADTNMDAPPSYFFHKGGMVALTKYLARKLGPRGIRTNCISPGGLFSEQPDAFVERYCSKVPLGRMACDDDIKGLVVFLASQASAYMNGENILMDGGYHA
jgi:NAD(P)-dependent dehydrogenase (short-subunit alcohol dehydrogenase family)